MNKEINKIEDKNINYILLDRGNEYAIEEQMNYKNKNQYDEIYNVANRYISKKNRIEEIYSYLIENINNNEINSKLMDIEKIIYEI